MQLRQLNEENQNQIFSIDITSIVDKIELSELKEYLHRIKSQLLEFIEDTTTSQPDEEDEIKLKLNCEQV